ncbi:MAG: hypothetical protein V4577_30940 [Bacteroidota bacterium]
MEIKAIINQPIADLGLGEEFNNDCKKMGFSTLKQILVKSPSELISTNGFNYNFLGRLVTYLSANQMLHFLQPLPGVEKADVSAL